MDNDPPLLALESGRVDCPTGVLNAEEGRPFLSLVGGVGGGVPSGRGGARGGVSSGIGGGVAVTGVLPALGGGSFSGVLGVLKGDGSSRDVF